VSIYAGMHSDLDTREMKYSGMRQEVQQIISVYAAKASFFNPEILSVDWAVIEKYIEEEPALEPYEKSLSDLFRIEAHTPSEAEGRIIALSGMVSGVSSSVYSTFSNAEMPKAEVVLSSGE
jgi:oligoendopeptidase F